MGGSASTHSDLPVQDSTGRARNIEEMSAVLLPIYYVSDPISPQEKEKALRSWKVIASGQAAEFYRLKRADPETITCSTPIEFFGNRFVQRFFEVHPIAAPMFSKSSMKQGTLVFRIIAFTIAALDDDSKFDSQFVALAKSHNRMGIRAVECPEYDAVTHMGWVKIFSRALKAMVPVAVQYEIENKQSMKSKVASRFQALQATLDKQASVRRVESTSVSEDALSCTFRSIEGKQSC